ncbi:hypothetical protein Bbelb_039400 [Branchiostoma belcheri]|nr:hypothetical protein Bbelb_039400 [Branchiostoma belcheri]
MGPVQRDIVGQMEITLAEDPGGYSTAYTGSRESRFRVLFARLDYALLSGDHRGLSQGHKIGDTGQDSNPGPLGCARQVMIDVVGGSLVSRTMPVPEPYPGTVLDTPDSCLGVIMSPCPEGYCRRDGD